MHLWSLVFNFACCGRRTWHFEKLLAWADPSVHILLVLRMYFFGTSFRWPFGFGVLSCDVNAYDFGCILWISLQLTSLSSARRFEAQLASNMRFLTAPTLLFFEVIFYCGLSGIFGKEYSFPFHLLEGFLWQAAERTWSIILNKIWNSFLQNRMMKEQTWVPDSARFIFVGDYNFGKSSTESEILVWKS